MNPQLEKINMYYAETVIELLDLHAKIHQVSRRQLVEMFIDTINALLQNKEQED